MRRAIRVPRCKRQRPPTLASSDDEAKGEVVAAVSRRRWLGVAWRTPGGVRVAVSAWAQNVGVEALLEQALS